MRRVLVQAGHVGRTRGATGTRGAYITEQQATEQLAAGVVWLLGLNHVAPVYVPADPSPWPAGWFDVAVALHFDGSTNRNARGMSYGYPAWSGGPSRVLADYCWDAARFAGYTGGRRPDNYTGRRMTNYYAWPRLAGRTGCALLIEGGFLTNPLDEQWVIDTLDTGRQALAIAASVLHFIDTNLGGRW